MLDMGVEGGCSDTKVGDCTGGDCTRGGASVEGRGEGSDWLSFTWAASSSLPADISTATLSGTLTSVLADAPSTALDVSAGGSAGLSGLEPKSEEALESAFSPPLLTAFASLSCSLEFGLLREELRDASAVSFHRATFTLLCWSTHLAQPPTSYPRLPSRQYLASLMHHLPLLSNWPGHLRPVYHRGATQGLIWRCSTSLFRSLC
jgi:hypothetical protein